MEQNLRKFVKRLKRPEVWISYLGVLVLSSIYINWLLTTDDISIGGGISSFLCVTLFAVVCLRFVPVWIRSWKPHSASLESSLTGQEKDDKKEIDITSLKIFFSLILANIVVILCVYFMRYALYGTRSFTEYLDFWKCLDSAHYIDIAKDWYLTEGTRDRLVQLVFLPGYPVVIKLVNFVINNFLYSGLIVSSLCFGGAGVAFYRLLRLDYDKKDSLRAVRFLCLAPGAFFFTAPMSESLFLLLSLLCIYLARKRKWFFACLVGGYAAFTRSLGIVLMVPVFFELITGLSESRNDNADKKRIIKTIFNFLSLLLIASGFLAYCIINYQVSGDPMKFSQYQEQHWGQTLGFFFNTASYQFDNVVNSFSSNVTNMLGLWLPNVITCFSSLVLMIYGAKKIRPSYTAYFLVYYMVAIGTTWLLSAPRYMLSLFPLTMTVSMLAKKRECDTVLTVGCCLFYVLYLYAFVMRWQVW